MQFDEDFFIYEIDFLAIAPNASPTGNINIQADSDFKWIKSAQFTDVAAAGMEVSTQILPLATVLITDTGSGRQLMSTAVPVCNLFGTGQLPFIMPLQRVFKARSSITFNVSNYDATQTYNMRLSLIGTKLFRPVN